MDPIGPNSQACILNLGRSSGAISILKRTRSGSKILCTSAAVLEPEICSEIRFIHHCNGVENQI
ncbi:hypothetical protein M5K25_019732 [Dendrobium thyrsiflorum]|uniref:Uncharacterized protein n=1 Tax=Dendrobium thyrsiflorum TaxID=117978 RepID=A0ABD0UFS7_DENTH